MTNRKCYLVDTDHDGIVGIYTNIRSARGHAIAYARGDCDKRHNPRSGEDILRDRNEFIEHYDDVNSVFIAIRYLQS